MHTYKVHTTSMYTSPDLTHHICLCKNIDFFPVSSEKKLTIDLFPLDIGFDLDPMLHILNRSGKRYFTSQPK